MKEYVLHMTSCGGNVKTKLFTNKRKAKSYAYSWINDQKRIHRDIAQDRDYMELKAYIVVYAHDCYNNQETVAYYI